MKKNRKQSKEHIKKLVASRRASPVWRIKISEGMKKKWADPEYKEMMRLAKINAFKNNVGNIRQNTIKAQKAAMEKTKNTTIEIFVKSLLENNNINFVQQFKIDKYFYDFAIGKKLIEVNGDYWHANPKIYDENKIFYFQNRSMTASEIWKKDKVKDSVAKDNGYKILRIWEKDIKNNQTKIIKKILHFMEK
jgi:very-short-patch-repair endonuclease